MTDATQTSDTQVDLGVLDLTRWPVLQIALENQAPAHSFRITWMPHEWTDLETETLVNFTEIFRTPFAPNEEDGGFTEHLALVEHLDRIETALWDGVPSYQRGTLTPRHSCGGVLHYLQRDPIPSADRIRLRPLRMTCLLRNRQAPGKPVMHEYLSEFSLEVLAAHPLKRK